MEDIFVGAVGNLQNYVEINSVSNVIDNLCATQSDSVAIGDKQASNLCSSKNGFHP